MTCNVGNNRAAPEKLISAIKDAEADLVAFQELSDQQAQVLRKDLLSIYPHQAIYPGGFAGKALLSRFPILDSKQLHFSVTRPDLKTVVDIGGEEIKIISAHPPPPIMGWNGLKFDPPTWQQIKSLADLTVLENPAVLVGDFNLVDWSAEHKFLSRLGLKDAYQVAGRGTGNTLPRRIGPWKRLLTLNRLLSWVPLIPLLRVDYIWYTDDLSCRRAWVGGDTGSDHLPVMAEMAIKN
jgi:endonuclease/exonuclease/phosphatase (EEP) superfamily protein YafD